MCVASTCSSTWLEPGPISAYSWPGEGDTLYRALVERAAAESARRWTAAIGSKAEPMLWRLLRIGSAPYFVLGASAKGFTRYRIATMM